MTKKKLETPKPTPLTEKELEATRTKADNAMISNFMERRINKSKAPKIKASRDAEGTYTVALTGKDEQLAAVACMEAFGTTSQDFQSYAMEELFDAACRGGADKPYPEHQMNGVLAAMYGIAPRDEIEGMLAAQMVATHIASIKALRRLKNSDTVPQQDSNGNLAIKLMRTFTAQMEALNRYRGKGQQKMTVEHVHVHAGGQAIVGNVTHPEGGGVQKKKGEQPHAITHAPEQEMPSQDTKRETVPVTSDA